MGYDGKTGETLMKSVLAPMFAKRNLDVMSWVGHNIFGNMDGKVLDDPANKKSKVTSKDRLLSQILGYPPQTLVSIEYIKSMGDWKTAWDHVHFRGFLGTPMTFQFTWQGCDSLLAAPLVLDLVRSHGTSVLPRRYRCALSPSGVVFQKPIGNDPTRFRGPVCRAAEMGCRNAERARAGEIVRCRVGIAHHEFQPALNGHIDVDRAILHLAERKMRNFDSRLGWDVFGLRASTGKKRSLT